MNEKKKTPNPVMAQEQDLVISRVFNAPREQVWRAFTDPELLMKWWGPKGFTCPVAKIDLRVGGKYLNCMKSPDGQEFWSTGVYKEIVEPERIVATDSFADDKGNQVHAEHYGMNKDFPMEMLMEFHFEEEGDKTKFTLRHKGLPNVEMVEATRTGWSESFDKLDDLFENYDELL